MKARNIQGQIDFDGEWMKAGERKQRLLVGAIMEASHWGQLNGDTTDMHWGFELGSPGVGATCYSNPAFRNIKFNRASSLFAMGTGITKDPPAFGKAGQPGGAAPFNVSFDLLGTVLHEMAHAKTRYPVILATHSKPLPKKLESIVRETVSQYAADSIPEFIAEVRSGWQLGRRYNATVMKAYAKYGGPLEGMIE
jgi:hypothetical protein